MTQYQRFLLAGVVSLVLSGCSFDGHPLVIAVSTEEPAPSISETIRENLESRGIEVSIESYADLTSIVAALSNGDLDLALIEEPDKLVPGLVSLAPMYPSILHVMYRHAERPADFASLIRNSNVYAGPPGGAANRLLMQLAADFDIAMDEFQLLDNPWETEPDVYFVFGGLLSNKSIGNLIGYRLFSFGRSDDATGTSIADGIVLRHHYLNTFTLPRNIYHSLGDDPVLTLSIRSVLVAREDLDTDIAFDIAATLFKNAQNIASDYSLVTQELNDSLDPVDLMLPLHEGARQYLDRNRPSFVERHVDVLALCFTVVVTLLSAFIALYRHKLQVRKDRVDVYYGQLLDIRADIEAATGKHDTNKHRRRVLEVQHEVMTLLIDERIAADASLMGFISLSNQLINEIDQSREITK